MGFFLIYVEMCRVRALVRVPLDKWSLSGHYGIRHFPLTYLVYEIWAQIFVRPELVMT